MVLFEMWSLGKKPYGEMDNVDVSAVCVHMNVTVHLCNHIQ